MQLEGEYFQGLCSGLYGEQNPKIGRDLGNVIYLALMRRSTDTMVVAFSVDQ
jgi:hypothetical protein